MRNRRKKPINTETAIRHKIVTQLNLIIKNLYGQRSQKLIQEIVIANQIKQGNRFPGFIYQGKAYGVESPKGLRSVPKHAKTLHPDLRHQMDKIVVETHETFMSRVQLHNYINEIAEVCYTSEDFHKFLSYDIVHELQLFINNFTQEEMQNTLITMQKALFPSEQLTDHKVNQIKDKHAKAVKQLKILEVKKVLLGG